MALPLVYPRYAENRVRHRDPHSTRPHQHSTTSPGSLKSCGRFRHYNRSCCKIQWRLGPPRLIGLLLWGGGVRGLPRSRPDIQVCVAIVIKGSYQSDRIFTGSTHMALSGSSRLSRNSSNRGCTPIYSMSSLPSKLFLYPRVVAWPCEVLRGDKFELPARTGLLAK